MVMQTLSIIQEKFLLVADKIVEFASKLGLNINLIQGKLFALAIVLGLLVTSIKVLEKTTRFIFIVLLIILALSIGLSFVS